MGKDKQEKGKNEFKKRIEFFSGRKIDLDSMHPITLRQFETLYGMMEEKKKDKQDDK